MKFSGTSFSLAGRHHVRLSRVGLVKTFESMRTLARWVENGTARVVAATVRRESGGWLVSFTVVVQRPDPVAASTPANGGKVIGLDLGLTTLVTGASPHGEVLLEAGNPRNYRKAERRLAKEYDVIVVEDLAIANMVKNRSLAKPIHDAGWGELVCPLEYKAAWCGATVVKAGRFYPSSKTCSGCRAAKAKLSLTGKQGPPGHARWLDAEALVRPSPGRLMLVWVRLGPANRQPLPTCRGRRIYLGRSRDDWRHRRPSPTITDRVCRGGTQLSPRRTATRRL